MILLLKTDNPVDELYLYDGNEKVREDVWQADRTLARDLLGRIEALVGDWKTLTGVVAFEGPGSFTGLRIGLTVANTLADGLQIPIVGARGDNWTTEGLEALQTGKNDTIVLPHYGADPHITSPKK